MNKGKSQSILGICYTFFMVKYHDTMESIWGSLKHQIIQHIFNIKPYYWIITFRAKSQGMLILNLKNEHPTFSIKPKMEHKDLSNFIEIGLSEKCKGFQVIDVSISSDNIVSLSLREEGQMMKLMIQLAPYAPRFQLEQNNHLIFDSVLGWQSKKSIQRKHSQLVKDDSLNLDEMIRNNYSIEYLLIIRKTLEKKSRRLIALNEDLNSHQLALGYKSIAEAIQIQPNNFWNHYPNPNDLPPPRKTFKADYQGISELFQLYKRAKKGIDATQLQIEENLVFMNHLVTFSKMEIPLTSSDLLNLKTFLENHHLLSGTHTKPTEVRHTSPYFVEDKNVRFSFGKNAKQNHHLTFSIAKKSDIFMHIEGKPGSHLIIHHAAFDHDLLIKGAQLILALAKQISGTVTYAKVGSLKQTSTLGLVIVKDAKNIKVNADPLISTKLLENAKRY